MPADMTDLFTRAVSEIITEDELRAKLKLGRPLRLKLGMDPSRPNLHVGHAVGLRKLRAFQDLGHTIVLIVGDWTAQIGDPSGRDESRQMLTADVVRANAQTYMDQFFLIMDKNKTEVRWQSEWYGSFSLADVFNLSSRFTLADMLAHETFRRRWDEGRPVSIMELMYPLLQGYDSVVVQADVEFGGTDQKFNNLAGRQLQASLGQAPQSVFLWPLLVGLDGRKMSKSFGNTIDLTDPPGEMYGKVMSTADTVLLEYFVAATDVPLAEIAEMRQSIAAGSVNPRDLKMRLGREIVTMFHGTAAAQSAQEEFVRIFQRRELPSDMP
ncbi:MAG: tyrosine--tRNA ligase, partial [Chloroflexota bacterium]|nr:tyrosine--tRNA ligase [Chloroflexota bacterium]